jgi:type VI secretion system secreted protein VgrG
MTTSSTEFTFAWESAAGPSGPFSHLRVVSFTGREAVSELFRYEIHLYAREPESAVDPEDLLGCRATLRIATLTEPPLRHVHGLIVEAEEVGESGGGVLYRVVLMPPWTRAVHRTRSRIFLEKTTRQIIETVLQCDPEMASSDGATIDMGEDLAGDYAPADELFAWRITGSPRIEDAETRPYCVQYNESDQGFVARLLEEEGIRYHFEHGETTCTLVLSDGDGGAFRQQRDLPLAPQLLGRALNSVRLGQRLRAKKVGITDYNWKKPALDMAVDLPSKGAGSDLFEAIYPGVYPDAPGQGKPLAQARLERLSSEARYAVIESNCRIVTAGSVLRLEHPTSRYEGELLVVVAEIRGEAAGELPPGARVPLTGVPYSVRAECARRGKAGEVEESHFRPARATPKPRILGSQTAFVTSEPSTQGAEIHVGGPKGVEIGCVRLRFHWDRETDRHGKEPTSCWVRVSQAFAGAGEGGLWHPRVGVEVVVEFLDGDPDRPIVVGRVYNGKNRPPAAAQGAATVSIFKSLASPGGGVHNEFGFDDTAGSEQVKMHAGKDWNSTVGHDRSESVANDSSSSVGVDRSESTGSNRTTSVGADNSETIGANESISVGADQTCSVGANQSVSVGADQSVSVGANQTTSVGANRSISVGGNRSEGVSGNASQSVSGNEAVTTSGNQDTSVSGNRGISVGGNSRSATGGNVERSAGASMTDAAGANLTSTAGANATLQAGANLTLTAAAEALLQGATIKVTASGEVLIGVGGSGIKITGGGVEITGGSVKIAGGTVDVTGGMVKIN